MSGDGPKTEEEVREGYEYSNFRLDEESRFAGGGIVESFAELVGAIKKGARTTPRRSRSPVSRWASTSSAWFSTRSAPCSPRASAG